MSVGLVVGGVWLLAYLSDVLVPFAVAVLLAYLLNPIVNAFERKTGRRGVAVALTLAIFSMFVLVAIPLTAAFICDEIVDISNVIGDQEIKEKIVNGIAPWLEKLESPEFRDRLMEFRETTDSQQIQRLAIDAARFALPGLVTLTTGLFGVVGSMVNGVLALTVIIIVFLYLVFLLIDFNSLAAGWKAQLPPTHRERMVEFVNEFSLAMGRYFRAQALVAACCGVLFAIGFKIVGLRLAVVLGLSIGLLNMVPYLQSLGLVPAILLALLKSFEGSSSPWWTLFAVGMVFAVVQLIQDAILTPRIMGRSTGLRPWFIILSLFVWGKLLGFLGLVLAIPLSCLSLAYYRRFVLKRPAPSAA